MELYRRIAYRCFLNAHWPQGLNISGQGDASAGPKRLATMPGAWGIKTQTYSACAQIAQVQVTTTGVEKQHPRFRAGFEKQEPVLVRELFRFFVRDVTLGVQIALVADQEDDLSKNHRKHSQTFRALLNAEPNSNDP